MSSQTKSMQFVVNLFLIHVIISLISSVQLHCKGAPANARVESFPGYDGNISFEIYAGYMTVSEVTGRELFYYFVKSERDPANDPLLLWLTGGPGCTAFTGFVYEIGPMSFDFKNTTGNLPRLIPYPHSWTKVSNIIFLDSPVGTGFSYSNTSTDYLTGDFKAASDIHTFLIQWFEAFPEFLSNPFYVGGDSYSGIIIPLVVNEIANENAAGIKYPTLNLKGYLIGNGKTDEAFDNTQVPFAHGKGLISDELYQVLNGTNRPNILDPVCYTESLDSPRILTKSGDLDLVIPFIGTEAWVRSLNYTILDDWRSWWVDQQVAG
eukprot:PITA_35098